MFQEGELRTNGLFIGGMISYDEAYTGSGHIETRFGMGVMAGGEG